MLLSITISTSFSQKDDWIRVFGGAETNLSADLIETYDKGYLILVNTSPGGNLTISWLIKTDINGEVLWEKKIGDGSTFMGFKDMHATPDGGLVLTGTNYLLDNTFGDPFFMKLNECGEKEWCRIFYHEAPLAFWESGLQIIPVPTEDSYVALVSPWGDEQSPGTVMQGIWLFKLNNDGEAIWMKNVFDEVNPEAWNEIPLQMLVSSEQELIISGLTLYGFPGYFKPFIVSANFDGTENWWSIIAQNENWRGEVYDATEDAFGNIYATGWFAEYDPPEPYYPSIHKLDINGNIIFSKLIIDSTEQVNTFCVNMVNDSTLDVAAAMNYPGQQPYNTIIRIDSSGNVLLQKQILQSNFGFSNGIRTFDDKFLYVGPVMEGGNIKIHLHKFNSDLEYDSIYTQPFDYDYMCNDLPIISDTIGIADCDIWTNLPGEIEYNQAKNLVVYPNPAKERIKVKLPWATVEEQPFGPYTSRHFNLQYFENSILKIYDIYGKQVKEISLQHQQENELEINISTLPAGIYLINLYENKKKMASGKFIVK